MVQAYVLIEAEVGRSGQVRAEIAGIAGIVEVHEVTGPYDVIARAEGTTMDELARLVLTSLQRVEGITRTLTCPIVTL